MIAREAVELILEREGLDQPGRWPGAQSGITLGHGYDLGYYSVQEYSRDWAPHLSPDHLQRLKAAIGKKGVEAQRIAKEFRDIAISKAAARSVFESATLPKFTAQTRLAFPGVDLLPPRAFGGLVSLVFNRGGSMGTKGNASWESRREMREIRALIISHAQKSEAWRKASVEQVLKEIAAAVRSMKRLWIGKGLDGLLIRRNAEAALIEGANA